MADEFTDQNRISIWRQPDGRWSARIGPPGLGIELTAASPTEAVNAMALRVTYGGWIWDPTWTPRNSPESTEPS